MSLIGRLFREVILLTVMFTIITSLIASIAKAEGPIPRELTLGKSDSNFKLLGGVCYTMDAGEEALPCNPAFIARETDSDFRAKFMIGNNVSYLQDVSDLLSGRGDEQTVDRLFSQSRPSEMEAQVEGGYRQPLFGISFSPYRLLYFSVFRNRALPVVTLLAAREQTLRLQFGSYLENDWSWGLQVRGVRREFIGQTFSMADAIVEGGDEVFRRSTQNAFYLEPGLLKEWPGLSWAPQLTFALMELGTVDPKSDVFPASPAFQLGAAVHPPISLGKWEIGVNANVHSEAEEVADVFRLGSSYEVGMTRFAGSAGRSDHALGFQVKFIGFYGGVTYTSRWIENWFGVNEWVRTVFIEFGLSL